MSLLKNEPGFWQDGEHLRVQPSFLGQIDNVFSSSVPVEAYEETLLSNEATVQEIFGDPYGDEESMATFSLLPYQVLGLAHIMDMLKKQVPIDDSGPKDGLLLTNGEATIFPLDGKFERASESEVPNIVFGFIVWVAEFNSWSVAAVSSDSTLLWNKGTKILRCLVPGA